MKKGTKILTFSILGLFLISILAGVVMAADASTAGAAAGTAFKQNLVSPIANFLGALFGTDASAFTIQKIFLAVLLTLILYSIIKDLFGQGEGVAWWISIIISALSIMFLSNELIDAIAIQYGAMGAAILTVVPLIIMLVFTMSTGSVLIARIAWIFYVVYYFLLYVTGMVDDSFSTSASWYYLVAFIIGCFMFFSTKFFRSLLTTGKLEEKEEKAIKDIRFRKTARDVERREAEARLNS